MSSSVSANAPEISESATAQFHEAAAVSEIAPGSGKTLHLNGREIALFNVNGNFYAIDNACPHRGASLSEGYLKGEVVLCNWHCFDFNLKSGACEIVPEMKVNTYEVKVEGGMIYISC